LVADKQSSKRQAGHDCPPAATPNITTPAAMINVA
jgi:hypothetical protein